jgi:hypothetical protein
MEINAQIVLERAGFQIIGIVPASDRLMVAPGVIKRVYEAMYVKGWPPTPMFFARESMTPRTKGLYEFMFAA